jgi:hypothetical protein
MSVLTNWIFPAVAGAFIGLVLLAGAGAQLDQTGWLFEGGCAVYGVVHQKWLS